MACRHGAPGLLALIIDVNIPNHVDATLRGNHTLASGATYERVMVMSAATHTGTINHVGRISRKSAVQAVVHRDLSLASPTRSLAVTLSPSLAVSLSPSLARCDKVTSKNKGTRTRRDEGTRGTRTRRDEDKKGLLVYLLRSCDRFESIRLYCEKQRNGSHSSCYGTMQSSRN